MVGDEADGAAGDRDEGGATVSIAEIGGAHDPEFERTPPHDISAEQGVLGGMLLSQDAIAEVVEILRTPDFYRRQRVCRFAKPGNGKHERW